MIKENFKKILGKTLHLKNKNNWAPGLCVLAYHSIGGEGYNDREGIHSVSVKNFNQQIEFIYKTHHCSLVDYRQHALEGHKTQVSLTFDDGYLDNLKIAAPLLEKYKIPYTVFITQNFIKNRMKGFMTPQDVIELASLPHASIGAHGVTHTPLSQLSSSNLTAELSNSKKYLEDLLEKFLQRQV